jgi:uncharacterized protein
LKKKFKEIINRLLHLNNTPHEIALGCAIGVFIAILPVYGLHTVLVIIAALIIRPANKIAMLVGTNISLPPTLPFITWGGYEIGRAIFKNHSANLQWFDFKGITVQKILDFYPILFLGSVILGLICAVIAYFLTLFLVKRFHEKKKQATLSTLLICLIYSVFGI